MYILTLHNVFISYFITNTYMCKEAIKFLTTCSWKGCGGFLTNIIQQCKYYDLSLTTMGVPTITISQKLDNL